MKKMFSRNSFCGVFCHFLLQLLVSRKNPVTHITPIIRKSIDMACRIKTSDTAVSSPR